MTCEFSSAEEMISAYNSLNSRCLYQSAAWVLDFLVATKCDTEIVQPSTAPQVLRAQSLFQMGEFKRAAHILVGRDDQDSIGIRMLASLLDVQRALGQTNTAVSFLGQLPVSTSNHYDAFTPLIKEYEPIADSLDALNMYIFASILIAGGKSGDGFQYLIKSLQEFPLNRSAWRALHKALLREEDEIVLSVEMELPDHWMEKFFRVGFYSDLQRNEEAEILFSQIKCPRTGSMVALEAAMYYHRRNNDKAEELFEELRRDYPLCMESLELYANILFLKNDTAGLSRLMQELSRIDRNRPETFIAIGNFYAITGKREEAIEQFALAIRYDPSFTFAWTLIGHEFMDLENTSAAISAYTNAVNNNLRDFKALFGIGRAYERTKMYFHAILYFKKAAKANSSDARIWTALGEVYEQMVDLENAETCYTTAITLDGVEPEAYFKLGTLYKNVGDGDSMIEYYQRYVTLLGPDASREENEYLDEALEAIESYK